jgi:hypothetical protein
MLSLEGKINDEDNFFAGLQLIIKGIKTELESD